MSPETISIILRRRELLPSLSSGHSANMNYTVGGATYRIAALVGPGAYT